MKNWYSIQAKAGAPAEISIYDEIGLWGVTAKQFIADLKALDATTVKLFINSPGGSVFDALAMYNALRQHPASVEVTVMGIAASAASLVAMAGDKIVMPENSFLMIHNPLAGAYGNAAELRDMADVLDKIGASLVATYVTRTGLQEDEVKALLATDTYLSAEEAVAKGFADELQPALKVAACYDIERLPVNIRAVFAAATKEPDIPLAKEWLKEAIDLHEKHMNGTAPTTGADGEKSQQLMMDQMKSAMAALNGDEPGKPMKMIANPLSPAADARALAVSIIAKAAAAGLAAHADAFLLDATIASEADADTAIAEAAEVLAVCNAAKMPDTAAGLIKARVPLALVRNRILEARAALDAATTVNHHIPTPTAAPQSAISTAGIYAARRKTA